MRILIQGKLTGLYLASSGERTNKISEAQSFASGDEARALAMKLNHEPYHLLYDFSESLVGGERYNFTIDVINI